jgi:uncharacterized surface protein with fasciclin (FAS1) repeats
MMHHRFTLEEGVLTKYGKPGEVRGCCSSTEEEVGELLSGGYQGIQQLHHQGEEAEMRKTTKFAGLMLAGILGLGIAVMPAGARDHHEKKDIVDTAVAAGSFKTLATALEAAGLIETLKGKGPFTVFAPTDEAFAKLPAGAVDALLKDKEKLTRVLLYHVVSGNVMAKDVVRMKSAKTVQGSSVKIMVKDGSVKVDNANVVKTDIAASNGVIHVIDTVIMPK